MARYEKETGLVDEILFEGTARMKQLAADTMREVRKAMGLQRTMTRLKRSVERRRKKQGSG